MPLLTLFLFGIVQFGIAYDNKQSLNSAAREGARYAALETSQVSEIGSRATSSFIGAGSGSVNVRVEQPPGTVRTDPSFEPCASPTGNMIVAVIVELEHPLDIPFWGRQILEMEARAEFRCES